MLAARSLAIAWFAMASFVTDAEALQPDQSVGRGDPAAGRSEATVGGQDPTRQDPPPATPKSLAPDVPNEPPPPAEGSTRRTIMNVMTVDLPDGYRELLPNEALDQESRLPFPIAGVRPNTYEVYGHVDRWIESGFDGEAIAIARSDFERPTDASNLESLREASTGTDRGGNSREVRHAEITEVGFFDHPAIELEIDYRDLTFGEFRIFETHASTSGDEFVVVHLLSPERLAEDPEAPQRIRDTLRFIAPPKDPEELPDRLFDAALLGALIAIVLLVLRQMQRRRPLPE